MIEVSVCYRLYCTAKRSFRIESEKQRNDLVFRAHVVYLVKAVHQSDYTAR